MAAKSQPRKIYLERTLSLIWGMGEQTTKEATQLTREKEFLLNTAKNGGLPI